MAIRKRQGKDGKITWQVTVEGVRGPNGERKRFSKTVPTMKEARETERQMLNQLASGGIQKATPITIQNWIQIWLDVHKPNIEPTTRAGYEEKIRNYIIPAFGHYPIEKLDQTAIQSWVNSLGERGLAPRTIKAAYQCLHASLEKAAALRMIPLNPSNHVELPKIEAYSATVLSNPEIQAAINAAKGTSSFLMVFLCLAVGIRRGELDALKWSHIDLNKGIISIKDNRVSIKGGAQTKAPKSKSGKRTITIGPSVCAILKKAKEEYEQERKAYGPGFCEDDYVLHTKNGNPYNPDSISQKWRRFHIKHGLKDCRLHDLRHTCATTMFANNIDPKTVQTRLGHSSSKITMDIYVHRTQAMDDHAAEIMDQIICP